MMGIEKSPFGKHAVSAGGSKCWRQELSMNAKSSG